MDVPVLIGQKIAFVRLFKNKLNLLCKVNPFLFIRGLSFPHSVQTSLTSNFLKLYCLQGPSCPLQTILLSNLVWFDSTLQIVKVATHTFLKFEARKMTIIVCSRLSHPTQQVQILKKVHQTAITICSGLSHPTGQTASPSENTSQRFSRAKKPSEDTTLRLFLMNMKGLILQCPCRIKKCSPEVLQILC